MAEIMIRNVEKSYGETKVIHGVSIDIAEGELIVIVGPSGCGKSTLLRMVAGLEEITAGEIAIGGRVVNRLEPKDRNIAMVFQNYALYPHMSVFDNMAYGLKIAGTPRPEIEKRVSTAARLLELSDLLARKPRQLSGGQRQRVAMGRAIVRDPAAFLFDEPLSNLDAKLRVQMRLEIKQLQRRLGTTALYVTHDQVEAMTLADKLVVMNAGVADQVDTPMNIYAHPRTMFVASFIGSPAMNFMSGRIASDGATLALESGQGLRMAPDRLAAHANRPVMIGIRPEHLLPSADGEADFNLAAEMVETLGADILVHGTLADSHKQAVFGEGGARMAVRLPGHISVREGEVLPLRAADESLHLFDCESRVRLADL